MTASEDKDGTHQPPVTLPEATRVDRDPDLSVWVIWGGVVLVAIAVLPFAVRNQDMVRAFARMCGFDLD